jgi:hypothetical protein
VTDATHVYFVSAYGVFAWPKSGGATTRLATTVSEPWGLAADATDLYWADFQNGTIHSVPKAGGQPRVIAALQQGPRHVALDDTYVYWTNYSGGTVMRAPKR